MNLTLAEARELGRADAKRHRADARLAAEYDALTARLVDIARTEDKLAARAIASDCGPATLQAMRRWTRHVRALHTGDLV